ncbi:MAG: MFS transporter [Lentisphaerae bacterium]|nr:MFS transporter [Lentisphaerota bacterium]
MNYRQKVEWTPELGRNAELKSILSSCCTAMGEVPFTDAAVIILYAQMLGASDAFTLITTSLLPLTTGVMLLAGTRIVKRFSSYQQAILWCTAFSILMFGLIVAAPLFQPYAVGFLLTVLFLFSFSHTVYVAAWFPMLDTFVTAQRRSSYLGRMRFSWQLASALLLLVISMLIGKNPPIWMLQTAMLASMLIMAGKLYFIGAIPQFVNGGITKVSTLPELGFRQGLKIALENKPLCGYSVYLFILNLAAYGTIPLTTLYLKKSLGAPDNVIVLISSLVLTGMLIGSFFAGKLIGRFGIRQIFLFVHISYALVNLLLFFMGRSLIAGDLIYYLVGGTLFVYSFTFACANISGSSEMMALATPGNKVMAMAFCNAFYYGGMGLSRLLTSLILGSGALAANWSLGAIEFTHYQTLFLLYAICITFAASLLVVVPAIFPKGEYIYIGH